MSLSCGGCGARVFEGADWCTQCFTPASEAVATPATVPAAFSAPEPVRVAAAPAPAPAPLAPAPGYQPAPAPPTGGAENAGSRDGQARTNWWEHTDYEAPATSWTPVAAGAGLPGLPGATPLRRVDRSVLGLGVLMVVLGLITTIGVGLWTNSTGMEPADALKYGLYAVVGFYAFVMAAVLAKGRSVEFQPAWTRGDGVESLLVGLLTGGGLALVLLLLSWLITGQVQGDDGIAVIVSEGSMVRYFLAVLIACIAAPWVEELLFRGLLAESMAPWGQQKAALVSAVLFAAWHPQALFPLLDGRTGPLQYYVVAGLVLAGVYHRRGLKASIAAHTAFNGLLVVTAILVAVGPAHVISSDGVALTAPGSWRQATPDEVEKLRSDGGEAGQFFQMGLSGPSGAMLVVARWPADASLDPEAAIGNLVAGYAGEGSNVERFEYPMGSGVRAETQADGHDLVLVAVPKAGAIWMFILVEAGSERAVRDFDEMMHTVRLTEAAPPAA